MRKRITPTRFLSVLCLAIVMQCPGCGDRGAPSTPVREPAISDVPVDETVSDPPRDGTAIQFELAELGLRFDHIAGRHPQIPMPETMGGGVLLADFNRDAAVDVLFVNSGRFGEGLVIEPAPHRLFLGTAEGTFRQDDSWGLDNLAYGMGGAVGDFDNDGWTDVLLTTFGGKDRLMRNTGTRFEDVTAKAGIRHDGWSSSAGFFDMDQDGDLDLYIVRYVEYDPSRALPCYVNEVQVSCNPQPFEPQADIIYRNNGDGTFTDVSAQVGAPSTGKGLAIAIGDLDADGDADVYVANDTTPNALLMNDGTGRFEDRAALLGAAFNSFGEAEAGMGSDFADITGNGLSDIVCTNFQEETTSIYAQQTGGYFLEISDQIGVGQTARARLSFGVDFLDADNDGDEDLLVANGHIYENAPEVDPSLEFGQRNTLYENRDRELVDVSAIAGSGLQTKRPGRGLATADLDHDGDLDFLVVNNHGATTVGLNTTEPVGGWVCLWLEGRDANRSAIGAVGIAQVGDRTLVREVRGASSYLSACDQKLWFGLGDADKLDRLTIQWPGGESQVFTDLPANRMYHVIQGEQPVVVEPGKRVIAPD